VYYHGIDMERANNTKEKKTFLLLTPFEKGLVRPSPLLLKAA
jgi:hypothetical protein